MSLLLSGMSGVRFVFFLLFVFFFLINFFFGCTVQHVGTLVPPPGIKPAPHAVEARVLTTGPPGKSLVFLWTRI